MALIGFLLFPCLGSVVTGSGPYVYFISLHLETFLVALLDRAPGVVLGYHEEYEKLWRADEEGFVKSTELFLSSSEALEVVTDATDAISDLVFELDP